jgi:signal transduction histidine kinase
VAIDPPYTLPLLLAAPSLALGVVAPGRSRPDGAARTTPALVGSAVDNVPENAVEHHDDAGPRVRATIERARPGGRPYWELRVADDGPPIPSTDGRVVESGEGTPLERASGLGLWLVNWLVRESGGDLEPRENDPRGNVVVLRLPVADDEPGAAPSEPAGAPRSQPSGGR